MTATQGRLRTFRCACCGCKRESEALPRGWSFALGAMSAEACACRSCRRPDRVRLPVYATSRAAAEACVVLRGCVLELEVERAIGRGDFYPLDGGGRAVVFGRGWRASLSRRLSRLDQSRFVWSVTDVKAVQPMSEETR